MPDCRLSSEWHPFWFQVCLMYSSLQQSSKPTFQYFIVTREMAFSQCPWYSLSRSLHCWYVPADKEGLSTNIAQYDGWTSTRYYNMRWYQRPINKRNDDVVFFQVGVPVDLMSEYGCRLVTTIDIYDNAGLRAKASSFNEGIVDVEYWFYARRSMCYRHWRVMAFVEEVICCHAHASFIAIRSCSIRVVLSPINSTHDACHLLPGLTVRKLMIPVHWLREGIWCFQMDSVPAHELT